MFFLLLTFDFENLKFRVALKYTQIELFFLEKTNDYCAEDVNQDKIQDTNQEYKDDL